MKTVEEVKKRIENALADKIECTFIQMCHNQHPLMMFVADYYKPEFKNEVVPLTEENVIKEMQEYIGFAFQKARDRRGISAERSIWKFRQWLWALDDTEITDFSYEDYGISLLTRIAEKYKLKVEEV